MPAPRPEVAARLHELRFTRRMNINDLPAAIRIDGKKTCRWCGGPLPSQRNTWCSLPCREEFLVRFASSEARHMVFKRDQGVCAACGLDAKAVSHSGLLRIYKSLRIFSSTGNYWRNIPEWVKLQWGPFWGHHNALWEADHIVPVIEGGGCCGLNNYQTLCLRCHKDDTRSLARRRAINSKLEAGRPVQLDMALATARKGG